MELYVYTPITKPGEIRIIELQPSSDKAATIHCRLVHTTFTRNQEEVIDHYTALSYVWGSTIDSVNILVDGKSLSITRSLESALMHLRDPSRVFNLWADGICINQDDNDEKAIQVQQMGEVYSLAHHTIIFLGPGTEASDLWFKAVLSLQPIFTSDKPDKGGKLREIGGSTAENTIGSSIEVLNGAFEHVIKRPWFYRAWIYQELLLSRDPRVQCGDFRCTWNRFYKAAKHIKSSSRPKGTGFQHLSRDRNSPEVIMAELLTKRELRTERRDILKVMHKGRVQYQSRHPHAEVANDLDDVDLLLSISASETTSTIHFNEGYEPVDCEVQDTLDRSLKTLLDMADSRRGLGVFNPHDMIYAHLSLAVPRGTEIKGQPVMKADYTLDVATLYANFAKAQIERMRSYDLLLLLEDRNLGERMRGLMSWAPDWTVTHTLDNFHIYDDFKGYQGGAALEYYHSLERERLSLWSSSRMWIKDTTLLCSLGFVIFEITHLSPIMPPLQKPQNSEWEPWYLADSAEKLFPICQHKAWWELLEPPQLTSLQNQQARIWNKSRDIFETILGSGDRIEYLLERQKLMAAILSGRHGSSASVAGRRIASLRCTKVETDRLSLVPASTEVGDKICYLNGCDYPFVVRGVPCLDNDVENEVRTEARRLCLNNQQLVDTPAQHFKFVGPCFVEGREWKGSLLGKASIIPLRNKLWFSDNAFSRSCVKLQFLVFH